MNNEDIRYLDDLATPVAPGDEVSIIPRRGRRLSWSRTMQES